MAMSMATGAGTTADAIDKLAAAPWLHACESLFHNLMLVPAEHSSTIQQVYIYMICIYQTHICIHIYIYANIYAYETAGTAMTTYVGFGLIFGIYENMWTYGKYKPQPYIYRGRSPSRLSTTQHWLAAASSTVTCFKGKSVYSVHTVCMRCIHSTYSVHAVYIQRIYTVNHTVYKQAACKHSLLLFTMHLKSFAAASLGYKQIVKLGVQRAVATCDL